MSSRTLFVFATVFGVVAALFFLLTSQADQNQRFTPTPSPSPVLSETSTQKAGDLRLYPNPSLTPGDTFPNVAESDVCVHGYSSSVRDVPLSEKKQVYEEYGISYPQPRGAYEVDHFISLELGGSNDIKNLWPEPANPRPGFHEKDEVENYLHKQICSGKESLHQAQQEIRTDWYLIYKEIKGINP